jgi:hypothetical protein
MAELFGGEAVWSPFADMVYSAVGEVLVCVDFHGIQWAFSGVTWFGEVLGYGWCGSF